MTQPELDAVVEGVTVVVAAFVGRELGILNDYVGREVAALNEKIASIESRGPIHGRDGMPGRDGRDAKEVDLDDLAERAAALVHVPVAKDGRDGKDVDPVVMAALKDEIDSLKAQIPASIDMKAIAESVEHQVNEALAQKSVTHSVDESAVVRLVSDQIAPLQESIQASVDSAVAKAVSAIERPKDGLDGKSVTVEDVAPLVQAEVAKAVSSIPVPKDGVGLVGAFIDKDGHLIVSMSDGTVKDVGMVVGKDASEPELQRLIAAEVEKIPRAVDGKDGRDGIDGVSLSAEDFAGMSLDPVTRTLSLTFTRGEKSVTQSCSADGLMFYRDIWKEQEYKHGDTVTWGGSLWYAKEDTSAKPGEPTAASRAWVLVAKRGAEGRKGEKGDKGDTGLRGEKGERGPDRW